MKTRSRLDISTIAMVLIASIFLLNVSFFFTVYVAAQDEPANRNANAVPASTPQPLQPETAAQPPPETRPVPVTVKDVYRTGSVELSDKAPARITVAIGDDLEFQVENLKDLANQSECKNSEGVKIEGCEEKAIRLFLDDMMIPGIKASSMEPVKGIIKFRLERINNDPERDSNADQWKKLLSRPLSSGELFQRSINASIGLEDGVQLPPKPIHLIRLRQWLFWIWVVVLAGLIVGLVVLDHKTDVLREGGEKPLEGRKPYSLGKCQIAFWSFLILVAFVFIYIVMNTFDSLTEGVVGLLGVSAATGVGSSVINRSSNEAAGKKLEETQAKIEETKIDQEVLEANVTQMEIEKNTPDEEAADDPVYKASAPLRAMRADGLHRQYKAKALRLSSLVQKQMALSEGVEPRPSRGLHLDLLGEKGEVGLHRLQLVGWTLVLGGIFLYTVWLSLSMPDFNSLLVTLQGISGATYLGFKVPERRDVLGLNSVPGLPAGGGGGEEPPV